MFTIHISKYQTSISSLLLMARIYQSPKTQRTPRWSKQMIKMIHSRAPWSILNLQVSAQSSPIPTPFHGGPLLLEITVTVH